MPQPVISEAVERSDAEIVVTEAVKTVSTADTETEPVITEDAE